MGKKILAVNPGSTSTKIALFEDYEQLFSTNLNLEGIDYQSSDGMGNLKKLYQRVVEEVTEHGYDMHDIDAYAARSGPMGSSPCGVFELNDLLLEKCRAIENGHVHASYYTPPLVKRLSEEFGRKAYVLNAQNADELDTLARFTGLVGVWRKSALHVLNHKEVGVRVAEAVGKNYNDANLIVAHMGGGISVVAHQKGRMIDYSGSGGEGPIAPTRSGTIPCMALLELAFSGKYTKQELLTKTNVTGGLMDHLGTADAREIERRIQTGDEYAKMTYDAMIYQIAKNIGAMGVTLAGKVDAIALTGGLSNSKYLVESIRTRTGWIAPIYVFPGEYEMECLSSSVLQVLKGQERAKVYTGHPVFDPEKLIQMRKG